MMDHDDLDGSSATFVSLGVSELQLVGGGAGDNDAFGRCGPGTSWKWLGDVYTPECARHDAAVRGHLANGSSAPMAHIKSLPLLPAAIGSYVRERLR